MMWMTVQHPKLRSSLPAQPLPYAPTLLEVGLAREQNNLHLHPIQMTSFTLLQSRWLVGLRRILSLGLLALLTACASPIVTRVTSFNQWPTDTASSRFSFITPVNATRALEQATYEAYVQTELEQRGLNRAATGQEARLQVDAAATSQGHEKTYLRPVYQQSMVFMPPYRDAVGRVFPGRWLPDPFGPQYVGDRELRMMLYTHTFRVRVLDTQGSLTGKPHTVFESNAVYEGAVADLPVMMPYLVRAIFEGFPGQNGQVRSVKFDAKTGALIKP